MPTFNRSGEKLRRWLARTSTTTTTTTTASTTTVEPSTTTVATTTFEPTATTVATTTFEPTTTVGSSDWPFEIETTTQVGELTTVFVPVNTTTTSTVVTTTTTSPVLTTMPSSAGNTTEMDPRRAILEEILSEVNKRVKESEENIKVNEPDTSVFGEPGSEVKEIVNNMVQKVEGASFAEIVTLVVSIIVIIYYLDRLIKCGFRYSVKKNFQYLQLQLEGQETNKWARRFWSITEDVLERIWVPMWWQSTGIRHQVLIDCLDQDIERMRQSTANDLNRVGVRRIKTISEQMDELRAECRAEARQAHQATARQAPTRQPSFRIGAPVRPSLNATPFTAQDLEDEKRK